MSSMDNYELSRERAQAYFVKFDQDSLIGRWGLEHDAASLFVTFFGKTYAICRKTGAVTCGGVQAGFEETLTIFDLLCHEGQSKTVSGRFAPVNSLKGAAKGAGVETDFYRRHADAFDRAPEAFRTACLALGGTPVSMGDLGFRFTLFQSLDVILKFYHADEDFPASITLLWDENLLDFMFYETVFYAAGSLLKTIEQQMGEQCSPLQTWSEVRSTM